MQQTRINPWQWQDTLAFSQAIEVSASGKVLYCSGQTSVDAEGRVVHAGDMAAQIGKAFANLETVLMAAGYNLSHVVRLNYYTTDMDAFNAAYGAVIEHLTPRGLQPAGTLLQVANLAMPGMLVEIEATAVK
jgi:enamine deaminase RidA (YjgF/YER057c/UK114 family)